MTRKGEEEAIGLMEKESDQGEKGDLANKGGGDKA